MAVVCSGLLSMSLCACGEPNVQRRDTSAVSTGSNEADADGQKRAETAGRELLGTPAPALSFKTIDGKRVDLATFYGRRPVYLKFWATWCVPCRQQMPAFEADYARFGGRIETFAVNTGFNDDLAAVRAYRTELALAMPIAIDDGRLARAFNLRVTPQHVVVGRDGRILYVGHAEDDRLHRALAAAIASPASNAQPRIVNSLDRGPIVAARAVDGRMVSLGSDAGSDGLRALLFLSPWCESYLSKSRPAMARACSSAREAMARAAGSDLTVIGVASGLWASPDEVRSYARESGWRPPIVIDEDGDLFGRFGVTHVPTIIIIDRQGRQVARIDHDDANFTGALSRAAGRKSSAGQARDTASKGSI